MTLSIQKLLANNTQLILLPLSILVFIIYLPGLYGGFLFDDYANIVNNPTLMPSNITWQTAFDAAFSTRSGIFFRPFSYISFLLGNAFFGNNPFSMKAINLAIHLINGLLIYKLLSLIFAVWLNNFSSTVEKWRVDLTALFISAAWLLLPINLTGVLYIVQRMTSLSATFSLLALIFFVIGRQRQSQDEKPSRYFFLSSALFTLCSILSKEIGVLLPLYALAIDITLFQFRTQSKNFDAKVVLTYTIVILVPGIFGLYWSLDHGWLNLSVNSPTSQRLLIEASIVLDYIRWSILPELRNLSFFHDDYTSSINISKPLRSIIAISVILILVGTALWKRNKQPLISLGILWFFIGQLLESTIFPLELVFEHRNYLPSLGLLIALFCSLLLVPKQSNMRKTGVILVIGLTILYGVLTSIRAQIWSNQIDLAGFAVETHPKSNRAIYELARLYANLANTQDSKYSKLAYSKLDQAYTMPGHSLLVESSLIMISANLGNSIRAEWFEAMIKRAQTERLSAEDNTAIFALISCTIKKQKCSIPDSDINTIFKAVLNNPRAIRKDEFLSAFASYQEFVHKDLNKAHSIYLSASKSAPHKSKHKVNLANFYLRTKNIPSVKKMIVELRKMNQFGLLNTPISTLVMQSQEIL